MAAIAARDNVAAEARNLLGRAAVSRPPQNGQEDSRMWRLQEVQWFIPRASAGSVPIEAYENRL